MNYQQIYEEYLESNDFDLKDFCIRKGYIRHRIYDAFRRRNLVLKTRIRHPKNSKEIYELMYKDHIDHYLTMAELSAKYNIPILRIQRNFTKYKLSWRKSLQKNNAIHTGFLENIDTPLKAYFLGWMYSDGSVSARNIRIAIQKPDEEVLQLFHQAFGGVLKYYPAKERQQAQAVLEIYSNPDAQYLIKLGCFPNKSYVGMMFPKLEFYLYRYFILGFFDGDGCIYQSGPVKKIKFLSTDKKFLEDLNKYLLGAGCTRTCWECTKASRNRIPLYSLMYGNKKDRELIMEYFYRDNPYFLTRKKEKFYSLVTPREVFDVKDKHPCND